MATSNKNRAINIELPEYLEEAVHFTMGPNKTPPLSLMSSRHQKDARFTVPYMKNVEQLDAFLPRLEFPGWWELIARGEVLPTTPPPFFSIVLVDGESRRIVYYAVNVPANSSVNQYGQVVINDLLSEFQEKMATRDYDVYAFPQNDHIVTTFSKKELTPLSVSVLRLYSQLPSYLVIEDAQDALAGQDPIPIDEFMYNYVRWNVDAFMPTRILVRVGDESLAMPHATAATKKTVSFFPVVAKPTPSIAAPPQFVTSNAFSVGFAKKQELKEEPTPGNLYPVLEESSPLSLQEQYYVPKPVTKTSNTMFVAAPPSFSFPTHPKPSFAPLPAPTPFIAPMSAATATAAAAAAPPRKFSVPRPKAAKKSTQPTRNYIIDDDDDNVPF